MRAIVTLVLFCSLFAFNAEAIEVPGVIFCSNGKDVLRYKFKGKELVNLTEKEAGVIVNGPFAVSRDGKMLVWKQEDRFSVLPLSGGKRFTVKVATWSSAEKGSNKRIDTDSIAPPETRNLVISPDGLKIAYEFTGTGLVWTVLHTNVAIPGAEKQFGDTMCRRDYGNCGAVNILLVDNTNFLSEKFLNPRAEQHFPVGTCLNGRFGNTASYCPPKVPCQTPTMPGVTANGFSCYGGTPPIYRWKEWKLHATWPEAMRKLTQERNACYPVFAGPNSWKKGDYFFAIIYRTRNGWGPIEIYDLNVERLGKERKPGIYEFPVFLQDCQGLAWTPGGDLSVSSSGKVGLIRSYQIKKCIVMSEIVMDSSVNAANTALKASGVFVGTKAIAQRAQPAAANNVMPITLEVVASGLPGGYIQWVTDSSFLVLGNDGFLCFWQEGTLEKHCHVPSRTFFYSDGDNPPPLSPGYSTEFVSPGENPSVEPTVTGASASASDSDFSASNRNIGKQTLLAKKEARLWLRSRLNNMEEYDRNPFNLTFQWKKLSKDRKSVILLINWEKQSDEKISYAIVPEEDALLGEIDNPCGYQFISAESPLEIELGFQKVVIFKKEHAYAALKPKELDRGILIDFGIANWWRFAYNPNPTARMTLGIIRR